MGLGGGKLLTRSLIECRHFSDETKRGVCCRADISEQTKRSPYMSLNQLSSRDGVDSVKFAPPQLFSQDS
jgi:hypothetical protein